MDIYIKELVKETDRGNSNLRVDEFLTKIQKVIHNVLEPVIQLWVSATKQRDELLTVDVPEDEAGWKAEFDKINPISKTLDSVVSLVGQAS